MLFQSEQLLRMGWFEAAGRAAYMAGFHAAQALIFERTGRAAKTHRGVQTLFQQLTLEVPNIDPVLRRFLSRAYNLKMVADYETGPAASVDKTEAIEAASTARNFVAALAELLRLDPSVK